ncbi:MAG: sigma-54-dependent Fis family transcriptional regulator, partial [Sedimenticola sp.]|nr:sigma-54-dependent Fis family transcriptional regulator [Sedimenticola sp.]
KLPYRRFDMRAQNYLRNHSWHGNVRELKNLVQRLLILGAGDDITQDEVEAALGSVGLALDSGARFPVSFDQPLRQAREAFEKAYLVYQLEKHAGNVSQIAVESGMERTHLYRKLKSLGIDVKDKR